jgi:hypothetical protein
VDDLASQNTISSYLSAAVTNWVKQIDYLCNATFSDPSVVYQAVVNGRSWDPNESSDALDVTFDMEKSLYAYLIPLAWNISALEISPFIL